VISPIEFQGYDTTIQYLTYLTLLTLPTYLNICTFDFQKYEGDV